MQNLRLRYAIIDAKAGNMPKDTIDRAIKKGTGELEGVNFEEILYEGYGPGGVAILCDILTDNRNRTAGEVRKIFEIAGGKLGATGCVAWMFDRKGLLVDSGRSDRRRNAHGAGPRGRRRRRPPRRRQLRSHLRSRTRTRTVCDAIDKAGSEDRSPADHAHSRKTRSISTPTTARSVLKLMDALDDHDDVQNVSANFNIPDEALAEIEAG